MSKNANILLFHIEPAMNYIVRNNKDEEFSAPAVQSAIALKLTTN